MSEIFKKYSEEPWMIWLLIALSRQRKRQYWLKEMNLEIRNSNRERNGIVPSHPEWQYNYHGIGLLLTGPNNEWLDVNFHDDECATIDPYFFTTRIFKLEKLEVPEAKLKEWFPEVELIILAIRELQGEELAPENAHAFRLSDKGEKDWLLFSQLDFNEKANFKDLLKEIEGADDQQNRYNANFEKWLLKNLKLKTLTPSAFEAVVKCLPPDKKIKACTLRLKNIDNYMAAAVKVLSKVPEPPLKEVVLILEKLNPNKHHPYLAYTVCEFLLSRGVEHERCISTLIFFSDTRKVKGYGGNPYDYNLARLMLIHNPKDGVLLLRRALRSSTPDSVKSAAVLMAAIDTEWSNKELIKVLEEESFNENETNKRYIVAALLHSTHAMFQNIGVQNTLKPRVRAENELGWTWDERVESNMETLFKIKMPEIKIDLARLDLKQIERFIQ